MSVDSIYTFAASAFTTLFPVFSRTLFDLGPLEIGYLWSMLGVGILTRFLGLTKISAGIGRYQQWRYQPEFWRRIPNVKGLDKQV